MIGTRAFELGIELLVVLLSLLFYQLLPLINQLLDLLFVMIHHFCLVRLQLVVEVARQMFDLALQARDDVVFLHHLRIHFLKICLILYLQVVLLCSESLQLTLDLGLEAVLVEFELLRLVL